MSSLPPASPLEKVGEENVRMTIIIITIVVTIIIIIVVMLNIVIILIIIVVLLKRDRNTDILHSWQLR